MNKTQDVTPLVIVISNAYQDDDMSFINEFFALLEAAGYPVLAAARQKVQTPNPSTYVGSGFLKEIKQSMDLLRENELKNDEKVMVATSFDLTGTQRANLEKILGVDVVDRTFIILKIFESNARTKEAKLQVDIASLIWSRNHLIQSDEGYSQVTSGGGLHNKGSGEKQIVLDRRRINHLITTKKEELAKIKLARKNSRTRRNNSPIYKIAVVGYTNAGKSTLINSLLTFSSGEKKLVSKDDLFVTLETSTREINKYGYMNFLITDTVGFVKDLPTTLVEAFKSTLEEIKEADLLVHVVDISSDRYQEEIEVTNQIIEEIGSKDIPIVYLYNKYDLITKPLPMLLEDNMMYCSLINQDDTLEVLRFIYDSLSKDWEEINIEFPYEGDFGAFSSDNYVVSSLKNKNGYQCTVRINPRTRYKYSYLLDKNS